MVQFLTASILIKKNYKYDVNFIWINDSCIAINWKNCCHGLFCYSSPTWPLVTGTASSISRIIHISYRLLVWWWQAKYSRQIHIDSKVFPQNVGITKMLNFLVLSLASSVILSEEEWLPNSVPNVKHGELINLVNTHYNCSLKLIGKIYPAQ